jgi:hypothetical protein
MNTWIVAINDEQAIPLGSKVSNSVDLGSYGIVLLSSCHRFLQMQTSAYKLYLDVIDL